MKKTNLFRKMFCLLLVLGFAGSCFTSCGEEETPPPGTVAVSSVSLNKTVLNLVTGEEQTLTVTVLPDNATEKTVVWTSSDNTKATVSNGVVKALVAGEVTITAQAGDYRGECTVTIGTLQTTGMVTVNGVQWATCNVDAVGTFAATPESPGCFYQWNRKKAWAATGTVTDWDSSTPEGSEWTADNDPSPEGWRVPTLEEFETLLDTDKVSSEWTTLNGVNGRKFTDLATNNSFFLPAVGYRQNRDSAPNHAGTTGNYWSSTQSRSNTTYGLYFNSGYANNGNGNLLRADGQPVRSVAE